MDVRSSATALSEAERDRFLEALIRLKHQPAPDGSDVSVYDQYVALHGAVMAVLAPGLAPGETVNFGHWNIGFCAWHRQYLRSFERQLQAQVPGVTIPYWDWTDHVDAVNSLFTPDFLGSLREGTPGPVPDGVFRAPVPPDECPPGGRTGPPASRSTRCCAGDPQYSAPGCPAGARELVGQRRRHRSTNSSSW